MEDYPPRSKRWEGFELARRSNSAFQEHSLPSSPVPELFRMSSVETSTMVVVNGEDRISNLPEDVITHILSFLETKYSVRTSALSKRWKNLCYYVPNLIFHLADIDRDTEAGMNFLKQSFSFINRRISSLHRHFIRKFILTCRPFQLLDADEIVKSWTVALTRAGVQQLCLETPIWKQNEDIKEVFTCKTLVELKLGQEKHRNSCSAGTILYLPSSIHLPNLKTLYLCLCRISSDVAERLFTSCPRLESLTLLADCDISGGLIFNVSSPHLRHLVFKIYPIVKNCKYEVVIDAPVLHTLLIGGHLGSFHFTNPPSVAEAKIDVFGTRNQCDIQESDLLGLLGGISSVKSLALAPYLMLQILGYYKGHDSLIFPNLSRLYLMSMEKSSVIEFLILVPNLEYLKLSDPHSCSYAEEDGQGAQREIDAVDRDDDDDDENEDADEDEDEEEDDDLGDSDDDGYGVRRELHYFDCVEDDDGDGDDDDVPGFLLSRMKVIEIEDNHLWRNHMTFVKYLMKNAKVLDKMVFDCKTIYRSYSHSGNNHEAWYFYQTEIRSYQKELQLCQTENWMPQGVPKLVRFEFLNTTQTYLMAD